MKYFLRKEQHLGWKLLISICALGTFFIAGIHTIQADTAYEVCSDKELGDSCSYTDDGRRGRPTIDGVCAEEGDTLACKNTSNLGTTDPCSGESVGDSCTKTVIEGRTTPPKSVTREIEKSGFCNVGTRNVYCKTDSERAPSNGGDTGGDDTGGGSNEGDDDTGDDDTGGDDTGGGNDDGGGVSSTPQTIEIQNPLSADSIPQLVGDIVRGILGLLGTVALLIIVYAGIKYMTAINNPNEAKQNIQIITNAVIGLIIIMASFLIVQYVISALVN